MYKIIAETVVSLKVITHFNFLETLQGSVTHTANILIINAKQIFQKHLQFP